MFRDLRDYIEALDRQGDIVHVRKEIGDPHEIFCIIWELNNRQGPAVLFENVKGYSTPVVANIFGSLDRFALGCGFPQGLGARKYRDLYRGILNDREKWTPPKLVETGPCKEVIIKGDEIDLYKYPILQTHLLDGGPYITMPVVITRDEKFGGNAGIYRMMLHDKRTTGITCFIFQDIGKHLGRAIEKGKEYMDCAVAIGANPAVYLAAAAKLSVYDNELAFASAFREGQPIEVVKCETVDLDVPANSELILEGRISVRERRQEGPYGEWSGYFEEKTMAPVFKVDCITQRKEPLYLMTTEGHPANDDGIMRMISQMVTFTDSALERITGCVDAWIPQSGRNLVTVIAIKKRYPGWGKTAIYQAFSIPFIASASNCVIVVDDDIDPSNLDEVIWAVGTRVDPVNDVITTPHIGVYPLNPAGVRRPMVNKQTGSTDFSFCSKMGIDATLKHPGENGSTRENILPIRPDKEVMARVKEQWHDYGFDSNER
jgi:4-hydroxy-3-polyprenylbenzoate decarboxylase